MSSFALGRWSVSTFLLVCCFLFPLMMSHNTAAEPPEWEQLARKFADHIQPLVHKYCGDCHSTEAREGEFDLERFAGWDQVRSDPGAWQQVARMLDHDEMPPEGAPQPTAEERQALRTWIARYLDAEALAGAGDPGPVVLRRLNNAEYTYTLRDLTGLTFDPAREFPVDGAAGEGFTNTGQSLVMSPSMVEKFLAAGRETASHLVLLPDGIRFSEGTTRQDWTNEIVAEIRELYRRHTSGHRDVSGLDRWSVANPLSATNEDGRVDLRPYLHMLLSHREQLATRPEIVQELAARGQLNLNYLRTLANALFAETPQSDLLEGLRQRCQSASVEKVESIAAEIRAWQDRLWTFRPVGHFGMVRSWQTEVSPLVASREFRVQLERLAELDTSADVQILLQSRNLPAGGSHGGFITWRRPRIEMTGRTPVSLREVRALSEAAREFRTQTFRQTTDYLSVAFEVRRSVEGPILSELASERGLDPRLLRGWLDVLGIAADDAQIEEYLQQRIESAAGYEFVQGWTMPGMPDLSLVANSSDQQVHIPGEMRPRRVAVHPRPERWVAVSWRSLSPGEVSIRPMIRHAHDACGNGISWSLEWQHGGRREVLREGVIERGGTAEDLIESWMVQPGDLVSLIIGPRDGNHFCDLTEIDLVIEERAPGERRWGLAEDCASSIATVNPHPDRYGSPAVWHFHTGLISGRQSEFTLPAESLLSQWLECSHAAEASELAERLQTLLLHRLEINIATDHDALGGTISEADQEMLRQLLAWRGPLFRNIDPIDLLESSAMHTDETSSAVVQYGIDPQLFGMAPDDTAADPQDLILPASIDLTCLLPLELFSEGEFVVTAEIHPGSLSETAIQADVRLVPGTAGIADAETSEIDTEIFPAVVTWQAGLPIIVRPGSSASARLERACDDFRQLFPAAMCYARIVPVDEVVTLVLFHREDEHLSRLMLDDVERNRLDRLWEELRFVSQDALISVVALEQLIEFATQDADPSVFIPLRDPIAATAADLRRQMVEAEPAHVAAVIDWAALAYRRPLEPEEQQRLQSLYDELRTAGLPHDEAIRLLLTRILTSPSFLYRLEEPPPGESPGAVSDWELATRLSYFLSSSAPDDELRRLAAAGELSQDTVLLEQTRRLVTSDRIERLAVEFGCQWLHVRNFDRFDEKSPEHFPEFVGLREAMYRETVLFLTDLFQSDRSVLSLLDADHTFLNGQLAVHYGIPQVRGEEWRLVEGVGAWSRGGILTQATVLSTQAGASRTSPILRGNWVSETLLNERLPRPPANVPQLPETPPRGLSERELIEQHSSVAECAKCHARIDPYGFALEQFDAIGRFRVTDAEGHAIRTDSTLRDGTEIAGLEGLQNYLLTVRRDDFVKQFCRKLLGYALGRSVLLSDEPLLMEMQQALTDRNYRVSAALETIVLSPQFRMIRGADDSRQQPVAEAD